MGNICGLIRCINYFGLKKLFGIKIKCLARSCKSRILYCIPVEDRYTNNSVECGIDVTDTVYE